MNIFVLDYNPKKCAEYHCDKHVVKMLLETAQILCTVHHKFGNTDVPYKATHKNHPCTLWAGASRQNYEWLVELAKYLNDEYMFRFNHHINHKSYDVIVNLPDNPVLNSGLTEFAQAMPEHCKISNCVVDNYRYYYKTEKAHLLKYTNSFEPHWLKDK